MSRPKRKIRYLVEDESDQFWFYDDTWAERHTITGWKECGSFQMCLTLRQSMRSARKLAGLGGKATITRHYRNGRRFRHDCLWRWSGK